MKISIDDAVIEETAGEKEAALPEDVELLLGAIPILRKRLLELDRWKYVEVMKVRFLRRPPASKWAVDFILNTALKKTTLQHEVGFVYRRGRLDSTPETLARNMEHYIRKGLAEFSDELSERAFGLSLTD